MNFNEFKSIIERDIELFKYKEVTYEGELGDAMVHPEIKKFIEFGTSIFKRLKIVTNGGVRTPKFYKDLGDNHKNLTSALLPSYALSSLSTVLFCKWSWEIS